MKRLLLIALMCFPFVVNAQTKVKETDVPQSVLLALEKTYESYKVKTWYQAPGQYIAEFIIDGQHGRGYFTSSGDWQYSSFPVKIEECPTLMNTYFVNNYPGFRIKSIDYIEEMSGDNYYRMIIVQKGVGYEDNELIFDTRGKLQKSNAPDPDVVKREFYTRNNPDSINASVGKSAKRPDAFVDAPVEVQQGPSDAIVKDFNKRYPATRLRKGPEWVRRGDNEYVSYYTNNQKVDFEAVYDIETEKLVKTGKVLPEDRYTSAIMKYLNEKFKDEKYEVVKMVVYEYDSKYRDPQTGKKPKRYTYVVVRQKVKGPSKYRYTRMEFDSTTKFIGLLSQPLDTNDIQ